MAKFKSNIDNSEVIYYYTCPECGEEHRWSEGQPKTCPNKKNGKTSSNST